jgi:hypothetical protein
MTETGEAGLITKKASQQRSSSDREIKVLHVRPKPVIKMMVANNSGSFKTSVLMVPI